MRLQLSLLVIAASLQVGATDCGQVIRDPGFDLWCGDALCTWKVERGSVQRVGTWHEGDAGVELVGTDSAIEQLTPVNSGDGTCLRFDLVANVEDNAEVFLNVDVEGDGTLEMHERFPASHWKPLSYTFAVAAPFDAIRFELTKAGLGKAVLAQIQAETRPAAECAGLSALDPGPRKNGARCLDAGDCASGICGESPGLLPGDSFLTLACLGCDASHGCSSGETCGLGDATSPMLAVPQECVPTASREIGEKCVGNAECGSGICWLGGATGVCSECVTSANCSNGETCQFTWSSPVIGLTGPLVCGANEHRGLAGEPCTSGADCTSGSCAGAERKECRDGRPCETPGNCPVDDGLAPGACTPVGVQGGSCE